MSGGETYWSSVFYLYTFATLPNFPGYAHIRLRGVTSKPTVFS